MYFSPRAIFCHSGGSFRTGTGLTAADLGPGGSAAARWDDVARGLLERTLKNMKVKH